MKLKWKGAAMALSLAASGCADGDFTDGETPQEIEETLSIGQNQGSFLTLRGLSLPQSEDARQTETTAYYNTVGVSPNGSTFDGTITSRLGTLSQFISFYGFAGETRTQYYNRGDLGIGRDMHCVDKLNVAGNNQIACYVANFGAGDDLSEFTFGLSTNIAFTNLEANHPFATVAMVYRDEMAVNSPNRVFFVVYDGNGNLSKFAALDRHGVTFANQFNVTKPLNPGTEFGTPGSTFSNHIPSNCVACHGGQPYDPTNHREVGAIFLPFDLDQFEYEAVAGKTRSDQETKFKTQNEIVRKVAALSVGTGNVAGTSLIAQLDSWYSNTNHAGQTNRTEVFENAFNSSAVISGWTGAPDIFQSVVRKECRNCHMSNQTGVTFDTQAAFNAAANQTAAFLCSHAMPHSLQTLREFWFSNAPAALANYFSQTSVGQPDAGNAIRGCGPGGHRDPGSTADDGGPRFHARHKLGLGARS